ncbi:MAG: WG repeat-containing protein [Clostridia bacterium]|nr:WG repeat-containing protein [Clostridia bacterium]
MNLEESNEFQKNQNKNEVNKKILLISIFFCAILIFILILAIFYIRYKDSLELKFYIDGVQKNISKTLFINQNDVDYVNIKEFSEMLGYTYTKGEYQKYNENEDSCYINNDFEVVAITADLNYFTKYIQVKNGSDVTTEAGPFGTNISVKSQNGKSNTFHIEKPVKLINDQLYIPFDLLTDAYNVSVDLKEQNRIKIYTLPFLFKNYMKIAGTLGYNSISGIYENIRAIPYNLLVVGNNGLYGVVDFSQNNKQILSVKYENLEFIQNSQEFFMSADSTVGLLDKNGKTIIKPMEYDEISILDEVKQLYLVNKDGKYGVLNRSGDIIVHVDYDRIGLKNINDFGNNIEDIRNPNLLFDECIVVGANSKYGLFDTDGKELLKTNYETFGYNTSSMDISGESSVLIIPEEVGIRGIVVCYDGLYGIYDVNVKNLVIPCACSRIYSITKLGTTTYYMEFNGEQIDLYNYIVTNNIKSVEKENTQNNVEEDIFDEIIDDEFEDDIE